MTPEEAALTALRMAYGDLPKIEGAAGIIARAVLRAAGRLDREPLTEDHCECCDYYGLADS